MTATPKVNLKRTKRKAAAVINALEQAAQM